MHAQPSLRALTEFSDVRLRPRGHETTDQPRGWTKFAEELRSSHSCVAAWQARELYTVTLADYFRRVQSKEFIPRMHPVNQCTLLNRIRIRAHHQLRIFR